MAKEKASKKQVVKEKTVNIDGHLLSYHVAGEGDVLIFIHGLGGSRKVWYTNINELARSYECFAPDLIGFGDSDKPKMDYSVGFYAKLLDRFMTEMGIQRATLLGHSMGGLVATRFTLDCPQKVNKLVLVGSGGLPLRLTFMFKFFCMLGRTPLIGLIMSRNTKRIFGNRRILSKCMFANPSLSKIVVEEFAKSSSRAVRQLTEEVLRVEEMEMRKKLPLIEATTLLVWGEEDVMMPVEIAHEFNNLISSSCLHVIPDAGHYVQIEKSEEFNSLVKNFLGKQETGRN